MTEGWLNDEYIILFSKDEAKLLGEKYQLAKFLPSFTLVGLRFWDYFIVADNAGAMHSLPTIPIRQAEATRFSFPVAYSLEPDNRFAGKMKWYVKPLIFGGSPEDKENLAWVTHEQHAELVVYWNDLYQTIKAQSSNNT